MRYSKHNELILNYVTNSCNHPTAEIVYNEIKKYIPNISLGTVYRNLSNLVKDKKIIKISVAEGSDYYDKISTLHYHMVCKKCKQVIDIKLNENINLNKIVELENDNSNCKIDDVDIMFYGICSKCLK